LWSWHAAEQGPPSGRKPDLAPFDPFRQHLVANLTIGKEDFEDIPILHHAGGWGSAYRIFEGNLERLIEKLNEAMAA
jgi:type I restriction enzyme R subunit